MSNKEERTEYFTLRVTPSMKKDLEVANDNDKLKDKIIKDFVSREIEWVKEQVDQIDEPVLRYRAKLIAIKDAFAEGHEKYMEELESMYEETTSRFSKASKVADDLKSKTDSLYEQLKDIEQNSLSIYTGQLEKLLDLVDRYNKMGEKEKEFLKLFISKQSA